MFSFAKKIARTSEDTVYHIKQEDWEQEIQTHSYLIAVPAHRQAAFEQAMKGNFTICAEDYGRVIYYGAGELTGSAIDKLLATNA